MIPKQRKSFQSYDSMASEEEEIAKMSAVKKPTKAQNKVVELEAKIVTLEDQIKVANDAITRLEARLEQVLTAQIQQSEQ